ncbi:MAG: CRISPR-associated protein Cas4 [Thermoplasmata archaeon]|nr:CRISPR-associated protein Cas4 [Thermoplasmata archaeon]
MKYVSAGDIEKYAYCPLSWWLSKKHKVVSEGGVARHRQAEEELKDIAKKEKILEVYEKASLAISVTATLAAISGIALMYTGMEETWNSFFIILSFLWLYNSLFFLYKHSKVDSILKPRYEKVILISSIGAIILALISILLRIPRNPELGRFVEIVALLWVISANILFFHSLSVSEKLIEKKVRYMPLTGEIEYIGAAYEGEEIVSEKYGIKGKPDYIIRLNEDYIPVEEKSGDSEHPYFSHVMQIIAYCMIIEDKYGSPPPYGILKYRNRQFRIPYEEKWKKAVMKIRENILRDMERGEAHRNHRSKEKCATCARREFCPEKLI